MSYEVKRDVNNNLWIKIHTKVMQAESEVWINIENISVLKVSGDSCKVIMNSSADPGLGEFQVDKTFFDQVFNGEEI